MMLNISMKLYSKLPLGFIILTSMLIILQSCNKKNRSDVGQALYLQTKNKVYKNLTSEGYTAVFDSILASQKDQLANSAQIAAFYEQNENEPVFVMKHLKNGDLKALADYCRKADEHGLNPQMFKGEQIDSLAALLSSKTMIKNTADAYQNIAKLELLSANILIKYANALEFGVINPHKIYARYYVDTKRPDSVSMNGVLHKKDIKAFLDSIQPRNPQYIALQKALASGATAPGLTKEETERTIKVNLERLRWKNKPDAPKYVIVNIPDYRLDVMQNGQSVMNMKVCVGEGRNDDNAASVAEYEDSDKTDHPFSKETPQLNSMIYTAQVNPVWNIPQSIASKEIVTHAADDPYYLSNQGIDVYKDGKKIEDSESIDWKAVSSGNSGYEFKQRPGERNSLGKIKFLFPNKSSVYLHDTPAQEPFKSNMRAVSHGCVRLERPLDLAHALFGDGSKYDTIQKDMSQEDPQSKFLSLPKKVPVYITYVTCWQDADGTLQFRKDVYGLDVVLFGHLQKYLTVS